MRIRAWTVFSSLLILGGAACGGGSSDSSDPPPPPPASSAPTIDLAPGFSPDPATRTGTTTGATDATPHGEGCRGYIGATPDFTLNATAAFTNLRVLAAATEDTTLVIRMADGTYRCDDDGGGMPNPLIEGAFPAGRHDIYVGSYQENQHIAFTLGISELATVTAATLSGEAPVAVPEPAATESNFGTVTLAAGFVPDPQTATGTAGGPTDASTLSPTCRGFVSGRPDHLLVTTTDFGNLRVMARSEQDTTLVIRLPDGTYRCDDDGGGMPNPLVEGAFPAGTYQVYIGTYSAEATGVAYTLGFSELASVTPESLSQ